MGGFGKSLKKIFNKKRGCLEEGWHFSFDSELIGGITISDIDGDGAREILVGTKKGELYCMDYLGRPKWKFNVHETLTDQEMLFFDIETMNSIESKPLVDDINGDGKEEVIFGSELGTIFCVNSFGQLVWKFKAGDAVRGGIISADITGDMTKEIIFGSTDGYLYVLSPTGKLMWKIKARSAIESTPCVFEEKHQIIFGTDDGTIYGVNYHGQLIWGFKSKAKVTAQPVVAKIYGDGLPYIIVGSYDGFLYTFEHSGNLKWSFFTNGPIISKASIADVNQDGKLEIFFGSCDNKVYSLNCQGDKLWDYETNFWVVSPPIVVDIDDDHNMEVIVGSYDNTLYVLDAKGSYELEYVPGLSGVVQQAGHYTDVMTQEPGMLQGKKIWEFQARGVIVSVEFDTTQDIIVLADKTGELQTLRYIEKA